jgi:hypothetical protein
MRVGYESTAETDHPADSACRPLAETEALCDPLHTKALYGPLYSEDQRNPLDHTGLFQDALYAEAQRRWR